MAKRAAKKPSAADTAANLGFEEKLWQAADKLRKSVDAAEYKHVVLGLIFLKYVSDAFAELHGRLDEEDREDRDYYVAENVFWVPAEARWEHLQASAKKATIGKIVDDAMLAIERDNPKHLKGALPKEYARRASDGVELGELIDLVGTIALGDAGARSKDTLGRVYEYCLTKFAAAEGRGEIRRQIVEADLVEVMVALPGQLFYSTQIPVCLWFLARQKPEHRKGQTLFIDARKLGTMTDRVHRELTDADIHRLGDTVRWWRDPECEHEDVPGFCKSATLDEIKSHGHVLTPGRYVGAEAAEEDDEPFEEKLDRLSNTLEEQFAAAAVLQAQISDSMRKVRRV